MRLRAIVILGLGALAATLGGNLHAEDHVVRITPDFTYVPETVDIHVGDTVTWINDDSTPHTATRTDDPAFDTSLLAQGQSATIRFSRLSDERGFEYFCGPHPFMTGHVVVRPAGIHLAKRARPADEGANRGKTREVRKAKTVTVHIKDFLYVPPVVEIQVGDSVTWVNDDDAPHTATRQTTPSPFDTGFLRKGQSNTHTFNEASSGTGFEYLCVPHPFMTGRVVVKLAGSHLAGMGHDANESKASK
jgi:plastocyanin